MIYTILVAVVVGSIAVHVFPVPISAFIRPARKANHKGFNYQSRYRKVYPMLVRPSYRTRIASLCASFGADAPPTI